MRLPRASPGRDKTEGILLPRRIFLESRRVQGPILKLSSFAPYLREGPSRLPPSRVCQATEVPCPVPLHELNQARTFSSKHYRRPLFASETLYESLNLQPFRVTPYSVPHERSIHRRRCSIMSCR